MDLDEFSDDGFDDLPDNALQELENKAIHLTQVQVKQPPSQAPQLADYTDYGWDDEDDLDTTEVTNHVGQPVVRPHTSNIAQQQPSRQPDAPVPVPNPRWNPAVGLGERSVSDVALAARQRFASPGPAGHAPIQLSQQKHAAVAHAQPSSSHFVRPPVAPGRFSATQASDVPHGNFTSALQQRLRVVENELNATRGEISIIRSNSTRTQQQHEAEIARLKKINAEQLAKHERLVEAAVAAEKSASTELQFLQRDMKEVSDRARRKDTPAGGASAGGGAHASTPKKASRTWGHADGFDEMDLALSPSKRQGRGKGAGSVAANVGDRTPSKGKRKRAAMESPLSALETHTGDLDPATTQKVSSAPPEPVILSAPSPPFEFLQLILDHGTCHGQPPTFDVFSRFHFPSDPDTSFASTIFHRLPLMGDPQRPMQLLVDFSELMIGFWARCLDEHLFEPIKYLVALIAFTFDLHATAVAPLVIMNLAPTAQATVDMIAQGRHRVADGDLSKDASYSLLERHIDTGQVISLLRFAASACVTQTIETEIGSELKAVDFWKLISLDFVFLLLSLKQRLDDTLGILDMLSISSLPNSLGPIAGDKDPDFVARIVIDRVSAKLTENPRAAKTPCERRSLRAAALRTLIAFARYPFGLIQLARHSNVLPRLVTCLSAAIDDLYDQPIPSSAFPPLDEDLTITHVGHQASSSDMLHLIITQTVLLIHTIVTDPRTANIADIGQKLSAWHGGSQRYLLALGRLTFAEEDLVLEAGIDSEVVEAAHGLLEMAVTPDEGEIVSEAFGA